LSFYVFIHLRVDAAGQGLTLEASQQILRGDRPPETLQADAEAFAYPYALLNDGEMVKEPEHRNF